MSKGTPRRGVRVEDELWIPALEKAAASGDNLSDIIRQALRDYLAKEPHEPGARTLQDGFSDGGQLARVAGATSDLPQD